jgi:NAD(P)-dependent dehydrogenase (short-subunit alcohol dehydrogenase family)
MERILITGASRGIGLELARNYLERGDLVLATARNLNLDVAADLYALAAQHRDRCHLLSLDVTDEAAIVALAAQAATLVDGLDVLINNAGVFPRNERPETLDAQVLLETLHVNAVAPLIVVRELLNLLRHGQRPRIVNITSQLGSLTRRASGRCYSYCSSKAALNMLTRSLAFDLQDDGIIAVVVHPGWVQTDMGGAHAPVLVGESARGIIALADGLTLEQTSKFLTWDGREHAW